MIHNTPIQKVWLGGITVHVKREDMACEPPGPPFSKVRGLISHLKQLQASGISHVAYMDTSISMGGWGVAYCASLLNMKASIFYPAYKDGLRHNQEFQINKWTEFGANIHPLDNPNMQSVNWYRARKILKGIDPRAVLLPLGLPFRETVEAVAEEFQTVPLPLLGGSIVCCAGSGTMLAGIIKGLLRVSLPTYPFEHLYPEYVYPAIYGILCAQKSPEKMFANIKAKSTSWAGITYYILKRLQIIDAGYEYTQAETFPTRFPCNNYYDRKAWKWLYTNIEQLNEPILFWNIGGNGNEQRESSGEHKRSEGVNNLRTRSRRIIRPTNPLLGEDGL